MKPYKANIDSYQSCYIELEEKVCSHCNQSSQIVFVHGHEQCVVCKNNIYPCCQGEVLKFTCNSSNYIE